MATTTGESTSVSGFGGTSVSSFETGRSVDVPNMVESSTLDSDSGYSSSFPSDRRSRWDSFWANRGSNGNSGETATVTVEHKGDPSLISYDKEFVALQRDRSPCKEWNKRFPEGTIV
ncbi:hypothetical protein OESDEN_12830, partial [Oesophagostomum dentatum]